MFTLICSIVSFFYYTYVCRNYYAFYYINLDQD